MEEFKKSNLERLLNAGLVHKVNRIKKLEMPIKFYEDFDCFKLFINDLGLLGAMTQAPASEILVENNSFSSYKGSYTEQYVVQQFFSTYAEIGMSNKDIFYYTNENSTMVIDFVVQAENIYPI